MLGKNKTNDKNVDALWLNGKCAFRSYHLFIKHYAYYPYFLCAVRS
jgi:hypothetical protein